MKRAKYINIQSLFVLVVVSTLLIGCGQKSSDIPMVETVVEEQLQEVEESTEETTTQTTKATENTEEAISEAETESTETVTETEEPETNVAANESETDTSTVEAVLPEAVLPSTDTVSAIDTDSFIVYFSGIDVWGWVDTKSRSDVNIIAAVNTKTRHIQLINTPRDYYVQMPISTDLKDKLTHAGLYGVENSVDTLEDLYGIDINYFVRMNFSGFEAIINAVGGVDVYSEKDFTVDPIKHYVEGYNHLNGLEALAFVRERKSFKDGDNQRGRNQMALVQAMAKKVCTPEFLMNYPTIMEQLTDMFRTDIPAEMMAALVANQMLDNTEWTVDTFSVTGSSGSEKTYSTPNSKSYVMIPNESDVTKAKELIESVLINE